MSVRQYYLNEKRTIKLLLLCKKRGIKPPVALGIAFDEWIDKQPEMKVVVNGKEVT